MSRIKMHLTYIYNKINKSGHNYHRIGYMISCVLLVALFINILLPETANAASALKLYDYSTKKDITYKDKQIQVTINGVTVDIANTPGILVNGVALVPYADVFENSEIQAECSYNEKKGTITISKYGKTIQMTIGSKKATVDGKAVTMSVAPMKVKYKNVNINLVLVPSRFVSENLGLGYTWISEKSTVAIVKKSLLLSYNGGKAFDYTGTQGKVTIDGKKINLGSMPSIITNNTAMLRAKKVFTSAPIGALYSYNSKDKTITLTKGDKVLKMTVGSKTAYLNGNKMTMDTAPMIVKNHNDGNSYVMVPGSFTASCLGYNYTWDKTTQTSKITTPKKETAVSGGNTQNNNEPELSGSDIVTETGTILNQWQGNPLLYQQSTKITDIKASDSAAKVPGTIYYIVRDYNNTKINSETYLIVASSPFGGVTSSKSGKQLQLKASDILSDGQSYQMYGNGSNLVNLIRTNNNAGNNATIIELELLTENFDYDISLSADRYTLAVTVYMNTIEQVLVGTNTAGDYLTITGIKPLEISNHDTNGIFYIDLPYTANAIGDLSNPITGSKYINSYIMYSYQGKTQIVLSLNPGYEYYTYDNGNQSTILFQTIGSSQPTKPDNQNGNTTGADNSNNNGSNNGNTNDGPDPLPPSTSVDLPINQVIPELTAPADRGNYEIVIPRPSGVTANMVTHMDYYFSNYFVITLKGDYSQHFINNPITHNGSTIKSVKTSTNSAGNTEIKVTTTKLQGYAVVMDQDNIYIDVGNPKDIYKNIVVLDPGHGGAAKGAEYSGYKEKDLNFKILYTLGQKYFNLDTTKLKVYYTRVNDTDMQLLDRAAFPSKVGADLFVSLHMNAAQASVHGTEVFYSSSNNKSNKAGLNSQKLAQVFLDNIVSNLGTDNRGVKQARFVVVHNNTVPAVLIELGFMSNKEEIKKLSNEEWQDKAARTIYQTLLQVFEKYPTGR